jgi:signal transduction histidine kinase
MKMSKKIGLANKLTFTTVGLMAGGLLFMMCLVYWSVMSFGQHFLEMELEEKSSSIERSFSEPLWNYDKVQLVEVGKSFLVDSKYIYINGLKVSTPNGEILFEKYMNPEIRSFEKVIAEPHTKTRAVKIIRENQLIGTVFIAITNDGFITTRRQHLFGILGITFSMLLGLSLVLRFYFNKLLAKPLNEILNQIKDFEQKKASAFDSSHLPEEFKVIGNGLNDAWDLVKQRNDDITSYANDLEKLVGERTAELEGQIAKNMNAARLVAVGEMAADVAHEINNPLTIIDLHINRIKKLGQNSENAPEILGSVEKIQGMISRMVKIIKGLKSIARDGNNDPMLPFNVGTMIEEVRALVDMKIKGQEIFFSIFLTDPHAVVIGREVQISQVLVNLINNSVDAISALPAKWIKLDINVSYDNVVFTITDSGSGISLDLQEKIMRPFFTTKGASKGTGLGLSISKSIIEQHEGSFRYNEHSSHTQFIFTLKKYKSDRMSA